MWPAVVMWGSGVDVAVMNALVVGMFHDFMIIGISYSQMNMVGIKMRVVTLLLVVQSLWLVFSLSLCPLPSPLCPFPFP